MFDSLESRAAGYGTDEILKAAAGLQRARIEVDNELLVWVAAWADAYPAESIHPDELGWIGGAKAVRPGGEGTPEVNDLAMIELCVKLRMGTFAGLKFIGDVLDLRGRLPLLWGKVMRCEVEGWQARKIARFTHHLSFDQARDVDVAVARYAGTVGWMKLQTLTEAAILRVDADRMTERADERKRQLGVWLSQTDDHGLKALFGRLEPPAAIRLYARIQEIADALAEGSGSADERRAAALSMLGDELRTTELLARHRQPDLFDGLLADAVRPADGEEPGDAPEESEVHPSLRDRPVTLGDTESAAFTAAVERIVAGLDPSLLRPTSTLVVHLTSEALTGDTGVCRVPGIGPTLKSVVRDWLDHDRVIVRPVIDLNDPPPPCDRYEIPDRHRDHVMLRSPASKFPWSPATTRLELDHVEPYLPRNKGGPPGQTSVEGLAPLSRTEHRAVTHGRWQRRQPDPGTMLFRAPHGDVYLTNHAGTHDLGDGDFAQSVWRTGSPRR